MNYKTDISTTRTITGANIELSNDYLENDISSIEIEGNTEQDGTPTPSNPVDVETVTGTQEISITGKNLLNNNTTSEEKNGITFTTNPDGTVKVNGTATNLSTFNLISNTTLTLSAGTYILSGCPENGSDSTYRLDINDGATIPEANTNIREYGLGKTFTLSSDLTLTNVRIRIASGTTINNLVFKPMIRLSNIIDDTYEPFKNNNYNISLGNIELCKINDYKDKIFRSSGKNLLDTSKKLDGYAFENSSNKIISSSTYELYYIPIKAGETYISSSELGTSSGNIAYAYCNEFPQLNTPVVSRTTSNISILNGGTFTAPSEVKYLLIRITKSSQTLNNWQIEKGSVASEFEPYSQKGKWYIYKNIGKIVLNGSENWVRSGSYSNASFTNISSAKDIPASGDNNIYVYCDYYDRTYKTNLNNLSYCCALSNSSNLLIRNVDFTTNNDFKNWLSTHNTTVYYVLETPTVTEITDLNLLRQLEAIRLFDKINYITYTSSTIQPSTFRLNYKTSEDKYLLLNDETVMYSKMIVKATDTEDEIILTESNSLKNWTYDDDRYTPNVGFIGQFIARTLSGELQNIDDDFDIENREVQICFGIKDFSEEVSETRWYTLGSFIIQKPEDNEVTDNTTYDAMDLTILFNKYFDADFTDNEYTTSFNSIIENGGSVTALWLANYVCKQVGIPFGNNFFTNCDFVINSNQFVSGEMCRDVMRAISQLSYGWVRIGWDDVCYIDEIINNVSEIRDYDIIDNDHYYSLTTQKKYFGPINKITVGMQDVNGEAISIQDSESVVNDGLTEVFVYDNPITYTNELRNTAVQNASYLLGMKYLPIETETPGHPWLKAYQPIIVKDMENRTYYSYPFNLEIKYAGHIRTTIKSPADTDVEKTESYDTTIYRTLKNLKIEVDKQAGIVTILNSNVQAALDGLEAFETRVEQTITDTYSKTEIQEIVNGVAPDGTKVTSVTTSSGTFDKDGLTIEQSTADTKTNINADGMIIYDKTGSTDDALLTVNSNGVVTKNLKVSTYTELGRNSRFEDFVTDDYEDATAVFWIGS